MRYYHCAVLAATTAAAGCCSSVAGQSADRAGGSAGDRAALLAFLNTGNNAGLRDGRPTMPNPYGGFLLGGWTGLWTLENGLESEPCEFGSWDSYQTGWLGVMCDGIGQLCFEGCSKTATGARRCAGGCPDSCACDHSSYCCTDWTGACDACQDGIGNIIGCAPSACTGQGGRVVYVGLEGSKGLVGDIATFASMGALQWLVLNANPGVYGDVASLRGLTQLRVREFGTCFAHFLLTLCGVIF